ncbi:ShlB/FhaC/HecB family hemolysin secretion/activation protein [Pandoraea capi]|nr:ShlB/FhaC/HecB family hemolysin secretion/activation protein [Pandoraea capi]
MPTTKTRTLLLACSLYVSGTQAQQVQHTQPVRPALAPPSQADNAAAARLRAEQDQQRQQQQDAREREANVNAPHVRSMREDASGWPTLPHETSCLRIDTFALDTPQGFSEPGQGDRAFSSASDRFAFARKWTSHYAGKCVGQQGLETIVKGLQREILRRGYITTRVRLPEQDLSSGMLRITLIPGVIGQIRFDDPTLRGTWKNAFPARSGDIFDLRDLEQGLEQMKRVPNQDVSMQIVPSESDLPGQSDVVLDVTRTRAWTLIASIDNAGTRATGKFQGSLSAGIFNPLGLNDMFNAGVTHDLLLKDQTFGSRGWNGSYSIPWGYTTATLAAYASTYYQQIAGVNQTFVASGNAQTLDVKLHRVLSRSQRHVTGAQIRLSRRFGQSFIEDVEITHQRRNNTLLELGLTQRHYLGNAQLDGLIAYRQGLGAFGAQADRLGSRGGPTYRFRMAVVDANVSVPFALAQQRFRFVTTFHGQYTANQLYYIDSLSIGSRYTVRGFDGETMLAAARGFYWRNELQIPIGQTAQSLYAGVDVGQVWGPQPVTLDGTRLAGAVMGVKGSVVTRFGSYGYGLFAGTPLHKPSGFPTAKWTVGFQLTAHL